MTTDVFYEAMISLIGEFLQAALTAGLVLLATSLALNGFGYFRARAGRIAGENRVRRVLGETPDADDKKGTNRLSRKWVKLGGGFYGCVGLLTYAIIELDEIRELFSVDGLAALAQNLDIGILVTFFIESLKNFITAVTWPVFWAREIETDRYWLWIVVAWLGYDAGRRIAQKLSKQEDGTEQ